MKQGWKKLLTAALTLALLLTVLPGLAGWEQAQAAGAYGKVTTDQVLVRKQPSTDSNYWFKVDAGFVCEILDVMSADEITWYKVNSTHPEDNGRTYIGYIHGDFFTPMTAEEIRQWEAAQQLSVTPVPAITPGITLSTATGGIMDAVLVGAVGTVVSSGTNLRQYENGPVLDRLAAGTEVELLSIPETIDSEHWYRVHCGNLTGVIQAPFIRVKNYGSYQIPDSHVQGYVKLIKSTANLRESAGGQILGTWDNEGEVLPYLSFEVRGQYTWYQVVYQRAAFFVRSDCVRTVDDHGISVPSPSPTPNPYTPPEYVATISDGVNLRLQPAGEVILQLDRGTVLPCVGNMVPYENVTWYYVQYGNIRGYLHGEHVRASAADGSTVVPTPTAPAQTVAPTVYGYVKMTSPGVNVRVTPGGRSQAQLAKGVTVPVIGTMVTSGMYDWYPVRTEEGITGYVRGDCVQVVSYSGQPTPTVPVVTPTPTTPSSGASQYGYIRLVKDRVNLRDAIGGSSMTQLDLGTVAPLTGNIQYKNNVGWYPVYAQGRYGYIREDCAVKLTQAEQDDYLGGSNITTPSPTAPVISNYLITIADSLNLRASASKDSAALFNVPLGTVMAWNDLDTVGGVLWYRVIYQNTEVWVMGKYVSVMSQAEYESWQAMNPDKIPQTQVRVGYVKTTASGVNLRSEAGGTIILTRINKGTVLPYLAAPTMVGKVAWYHVELSDGTRGFLHGDYVTRCDANGNALDDNQQTASYVTLRKGSQGDAVKRLVTELKNQGYYTGEITSTFTSQVESAVKAFQRVYGLTVDGVAGADTQHKLFNTQPEGFGTGDQKMMLYPAEKIDWWTGGIQSLWAKGEDYPVYDVKTGLVWWAHRWSGGNHADVEPLTAADTAVICKLHGVSSADQITDKGSAGHWRRRPSLVTIGTRTFACSLYGVPHNPDGDTIDDNDMIGQLCIHFTNSKTHETDRIDSGHQEAIEYAWKNSPSGYK